MSEIYIVKFDTDGAIPDNKLFELLSGDLKERVIGTKNPRVKRERLAAYSLLALALNENGYSDFLKNGVEFSEKGRPYIKNCDLDFSVSHTDGVAAIAISRNGRVGIDVERVDAEKRNEGCGACEKTSAAFTDKEKARSIEKFIQRYNNEIVAPETNASFSARVYVLGENGAFENKEKLCILSPEEEYLPFAKWTQTESILKCEGGGFGSASKLGELSEKISTRCVVFSLCNSVYSLSISEEKVK